MSRPLAATNDKVFDAIDQVVAQAGPAGLTLGRVGSVVGVTAGALVQRFGSKQELLAAYARSRHRQMTPELDRRGRPALNVLREVIRHAIPPAMPPAEHCHRLAFRLLVPELKPLWATELGGMSEVAVALLDQAVEEGELPDCDTAALASNLVAIWQGAILSWAALGRGDCADWVIARVNSVLDLYQLQADGATGEDGLMDELLASGPTRTETANSLVGRRPSRK